MKIDVTYTMNKIGKIRDPKLVILYTLITGGIYGAIWFCIIAHELRDYRIKGAPGWFLALGIFVPLVNFAFSIAVTYYLFEIPHAIGKERVKVTLPRGINGKLGLLPFIALIVLITIFVLWFNSVLSFGYYIVLGILISVAMIFVWMHRIQVCANELWQYALASRPFARPEKTKLNQNINQESW